MSEGVRIDDARGVRLHEPGPVRGTIGPGPIALAAAVGSIGPVGFALGRSPIVMATEHRPVALAAVATLALVTSTVVGRARPRTLLAVLPVLAVAGALATWSTAGRIQGVWCVLATAGAMAVLRSARPAGRSPSRWLAGSVGLLGVAVAGLLWALDGSGAVPAAVLAVSLVPAVLIRDDRVVRSGDRAAGRAGAVGRRAGGRVLGTAGSVARDLRDRGARPTIRGSMVGSGLVAAALTAPIFHRLASSPATMVNGFNDYRSHLDFAAAIGWSPLRITVPHPVFHVLVRLLEAIASEPVAVTLVLSAAVGLTVASLTWIATLPMGGLPGLSPRAAPLFSLGFVLVESPTAALQAAGLLGPDGRYAPIHVWASPTEVVLLPFVFLLVVKVAELLDDPRPDRRLVITTAALGAGAALAKPSLTIALVPALVLLLVLRRSGSAASTRAAIGAVVVPSLAILAWQTWFLAAGNVPQGASDFALRPLETVRTLRIGEESPWFWSALVIIPLAVWIGGRSFVRDRTIQVTLATLGCALAITLLFFEGGIRRADGNLAKPSYFAWLLLFTWCFRFVVAALVAQRRDRRSGSPRPRWVPAAGLVLAVLVLGGVLAWLDAVGLIRIPGWQVSA